MLLLSFGSARRKTGLPTNGLWRRCIELCIVHRERAGGWLLTSEISGADELELVIWMDAGGPRAKGRDHTGRRRRARRPRPESERVAAGHSPAEAWSAGAATPRDGRDTGAGRGGRGGSTTMLSSPGCPRVPAEVVGSRRLSASSEG